MQKDRQYSIRQARPRRPPADRTTTHILLSPCHSDTTPACATLAWPPHGNTTAWTAANLHGCKLSRTELLVGQTLPLVRGSRKRGPRCPRLGCFVRDHHGRSRRYFPPRKPIHSERARMPLAIRRHVTHAHHPAVVTPPLVSAGPEKLLQRTDLVFQRLHRFHGQSTPLPSPPHCHTTQTTCDANKRGCHPAQPNTSPHKHSHRTLCTMHPCSCVDCSRETANGPRSTHSHHSRDQHAHAIHLICTPLPSRTRLSHHASPHTTSHQPTHHEGRVSSL